MPNIYERRIAEWEQQYGGLSPEVQRKIDKLVEQYDQKQELDKNSKAFSIAEGARLIREFKGKQYTVTIISGGYEFNGKKYKSLSAIANEITGTRWNGRKFFGVA